MAIWFEMVMALSSMGPACSRWESAEKISSSRFWMMIDRPKVTSSGGMGPSSSAKLSRPRCSA